MRTWTVTFTPDKTSTQQTEVSGKSYTDAYINFTRTHPQNCDILEITEKEV